MIVISSMERSSSSLDTGLKRESQQIRLPADLIARIRGLRSTITDPLISPSTHMATHTVEFSINLFSFCMSDGWHALRLPSSMDKLAALLASSIRYERSLSVRQIGRAHV